MVTNQVVSRKVTRIEVEEFLFFEAALLDEWRLDEWLELFAPGATYIVPATDDPEGDPRTNQVLISDSYEQIQARVTRLKSRHAHAENPRSRTRRLVTNVRIVHINEDMIDVTASFLVYRIKYGTNAWFVGQYRHQLALVDGHLKFRIRRAVIDQESLSLDGRVSIIL